MIVPEGYVWHHHELRAALIAAKDGDACAADLGAQDDAQALLGLVFADASEIMKLRTVLAANARACEE